MNQDPNRFRIELTVSCGACASIPKVGGAGKIFEEAGAQYQQILAEHDVHESFSGDGLIAVYFGAEPLAWNAPKLSFNRYSNGTFRNPIYDLAEVQHALRLAQQQVAPQAAPQALTELGPKSLLSRLFTR
jgi:hypothetical protein